MMTQAELNHITPDAKRAHRNSRLVSPRTRIRKYDRVRLFDPWERSHANGRGGWKRGRGMKTRRHRA